MNGLTPPKSGATEWPPGPTPRASRGAPEPRDAFAGILDSHQARTATAEGQDRSSRTKERDRRDDGPVANDRAEARSNARWARERREADGVERERPVQHHEDDAAQAQPADSDNAPAAPAAEAPVVGPQADAAAPPVPVVTAEPVAAQAPVAPAPAQDSVPQAQPGAAATVATAAAVAPAAAQAPVQQEQAVTAAPGAAQADAVVPAEQQASAEAAPVAVSTDEAKPAAPQADARPADRPAPPAATAAAKPKPDQGDAGQAQQGQQQPGTLPQPAAERARTVAQAYGRQSQTNTEVPTTAQSGTPAASPATPVAGGQPAAARGELAPPTPVPLARAAANVEHVMRLAANRGVTHARIALNPESLGSIDVHLRHTSDGVVAHVVAHAPEAVQQLQQAAADLRRQLEGQGVNLLSLDIGQSSAEDRSAGRAGAGLADGRGDGRGSANGAGDAAGPDSEVTVKSTLQLPNGVLVDVLA